MTKREPWILGLSGSHNGAAALFRGDTCVVAVQEERLCREKRAWLYAGRASAAVRYCLDAAGIGSQDLTLAVVSGLLPVQERCGGSDNEHPLHDLRRNPDLRVDGGHVASLKMPHHLAHGVSAFATSGFDDACVIVVDGGGSPVGDWLPAERGALGEPVPPEGAREWLSVYWARDTVLVPVEKQVLTRSDWVVFDRQGSMPGFGSLGGMFDAVGWHIFGALGQAGKVMGLAPFGRVTHPPSAFYSVEDGRILFGDAVREGRDGSGRRPKPACGYTGDDADLAASVQHALEEAMVNICRRARIRTGARRLCLAGGVALNSVANERVIREAGFERVHIVAAAEDSGVAVGAAHWGLWKCGYSQRRRVHLSRDEAGRKYGDGRISEAVEKVPFVRSRRSLAVAREAAEWLAAGAILGWFQGGSELGPRALGQRSILCDPRDASAKVRLNATVKYREPFRPFAPAVLLERAKEWFDFGEADEESPFMLRVCEVRRDKRALIPAVVHVDGSARLQTVSRDGNGVFYDLVAEFEQMTGIPMVLNTSYNVMGEPIVETPEDALWSLLFTGLDGCVIGDQVCRKESPDRSALDLVPVIRLSTSERRAFVPDEAGASGAGRVGHLWADACGARMPGLPIPLSAVNGERTSHEILAIARNVPRAAMLNSLASLHRHGVIGFRVPREPAAPTSAVDQGERLATGVT